MIWLESDASQQQVNPLRAREVRSGINDVVNTKSCELNRLKPGDEKRTDLAGLCDRRVVPKLDLCSNSVSNDHWVLGKELIIYVNIFDVKID